MTRDEFQELEVGDKVDYLGKVFTVVRAGHTPFPSVKSVTVAYFDAEEIYREITLLGEQAILMREVN